MILYDLFKVLDMTNTKCTVIANSKTEARTILVDDNLCMIDNKALYYLVDRIRVCKKDKHLLLVIDVIER